MPSLLPPTNGHGTVTNQGSYTLDLAIQNQDICIVLSENFFFPFYCFKIFILMILVVVYISVSTFSC